MSVREDPRRIEGRRECRLTGNARKELAGKALDLTVGKRHKAVSLEKVKNTLTKEVHDNAYMPPIIEAIAQMDTPIAVVVVVGLEGSQHTKFYPRGVAVFLDRTDDLNGNLLVPPSILCFDDLAKGTLTQQTGDLVCWSQ